MYYHRRPSWAIAESAATPESVFLNRRAFLAAGAAGAAALAIPGHAGAAVASYVPSRAEGGPYSLANAGRPLTPEDLAATYNNFYEFGSHKTIWKKAQALKTDGWTIEIDGMVDNPGKYDTDKLFAEMPIEERVVRHRCVEAWSMVVPWLGFPLASLIARAGPQAGAKYVRFETFLDPKVAPGQKQGWYPWPYVEGMTLDEATNELSFMVVGAYGKPLLNQFGAPVRLHLPWKYGFKSIKSITRMTLTDERPVSFWEEIQDKEYGFWANVNPDVAHPRWSQATEKPLGSKERIPTLMWNGYGEQVAHLYKGMEGLGAALYR